MSSAADAGDEVVFRLKNPKWKLLLWASVLVLVGLSACYVGLSSARGGLMTYFIGPLLGLLGLLIGVRALVLFRAVDGRAVVSARSLTLHLPGLPAREVPLDRIVDVQLLTQGSRRTHTKFVLADGKTTILPSLHLTETQERLLGALVKRRAERCRAAAPTGGAGA